MDIKKYEAMAKLDLPETERLSLSERAASLVKEFSVLESIDTNAVEPLVTVLDIQSSLRDDLVIKTISREELLSNAPDQHDGFFRIPKALV